MNDDITWARDFINRIEGMYEEWHGDGPAPSLSVYYQNLTLRLCRDKAEQMPGIAPMQKPAFVQQPPMHPVWRDAADSSGPVADIAANLVTALAALRTIYENTRCADPAEGGCIPSKSCAYEVARGALRNLGALDSSSPFTRVEQSKVKP